VVIIAYRTNTLVDTLCAKIAAYIKDAYHTSEMVTNYSVINSAHAVVGRNTKNVASNKELK